MNYDIYLDSNKGSRGRRERHLDKVLENSLEEIQPYLILDG
jgi:hypothetical protein